MTADVGPATVSQSAPAAARKHSRGDGAVDSLAAFLSLPGYLVRRRKQMPTSIFVENCRPFAITPIQFAALTIFRVGTVALPRSTTQRRRP